MYFNENLHIYKHKVTGEIYPSVTTVISKYKNKFKSKIIAEGFLNKNPQLNEDVYLRAYLDKLLLLNKDVNEVIRPLTPDILIDLWEESSILAQIKGNSYHFKNQIETIYNQTFLDISYNDNIFHLWDDLYSGYYPELRVWSDKYKIAGTIDKVYIKKPYIWITDYKTNKRLISKGDDRNKMLYPLHFLNDSSYYHYETQLNIYAKIFEEWGYTVKGLEIIHKRFNDNDVVPDEYRYMWETEEMVKKPIIIPINYYPVRTKNLLEFDLKNRNTA